MTISNFKMKQLSHVSAISFRIRTYKNKRTVPFTEYRKGSELFFMCLLYQFQQFLDTFSIEPPFLYEIDLIYNERKLPICKDKKAQNIFHAFATFFFYNCSLSQTQEITKDDATGLLTLHTLKNSEGKKESVALTGYDCVILAIGRIPNTDLLELDGLVSFFTLSNKCCYSVNLPQ